MYVLILWITIGLRDEIELVSRSEMGSRRKPAANVTHAEDRKESGEEVFCDFLAVEILSVNEYI